MDNNDARAANWSVRSVELPTESRATRFYPATDLADAFSIGLPDEATGDPEQLARFMLAQQAPWVAGLMNVRDALVAGFGIKTSGELKSAAVGEPQQRVGIFRLYEKHAHEVLLGEDDKHLDFRLSVLTQPAQAQRGRRLVVSTVVHCHNLLGRSYIALISPFHRQVVRSMLSRAAHAGWPRRQPG